ncbi:pre-rRNA processing, partial [Coemansia sp. RSA 2607]
RQMRQHRLLVDKLEGSGALAPHAPSALEDTVCASPQVSAMRAMHVRTSSVSGSPTDTADLAHAELMQPMHALLLDARALPRSRSMDFRLPPQNPSAEDTQATYRPQSSSGSSGSARTPVISILASRIDCCKTFTENLVFLLNRETDPATQILILHMLENILSDRQTCGIMYTNDMHVLIDVVLRALGDLAEGAQMVCQAYVGVLRALLCNPAYLKDRHRLSDVELCLVSLLRQSLVCAQPEEGPVERRAGAASPASSMSSAMSDETCCARVSEESPVVLPKTSRRPPPPPPRVKTVHTDSDRPTAPAHRRRPAPPPPPMRLPTAAAHCSTDDSSCSNGGGSFARPPRRKAPPPPPPSPRTAPPTPSQKPRPRAPEQTGLRRQLSVKKSVSKYKRDSLRLPPPLPPPRQRASRPVTPVSPVVEVAAEAEAEAGDTPDGAQDAWSLRAALEDSVEGRRATRKLVESALRCCHEARNMAVVRSPRSGVF